MSLKASFPAKILAIGLSRYRLGILTICWSGGANANMDYSSPDQILGLVLLIGVIAIAFFKMLLDVKKLDDPNDSSVVYIDQIASVANLKSSRAFGVRIYRQSGHLQQDDREFSSENEQTDPSLVINEAIKTFRRAKIEYVVIDQNTEIILEFSRPYHDHRGVKEGKKVGSCVIVAIND